MYFLICGGEVSSTSSYSAILITLPLSFSLLSSSHSLPFPTQGTLWYNVLATLRDVLKNVSLSPVSSIWVSLYSSPNTPMPVLHAGPVPTFSSQNQPSRRQTPTANPLSPSPPHLQAKPQEGPVAAISKGPVADVVPPRRVQTPATLSLGRVERSRSYRTWRKAGKGHLAGRMGRQ